MAIDTGNEPIPKVIDVTEQINKIKGATKEEAMNLLSKFEVKTSPRKQVDHYPIDFSFEGEASDEVIANQLEKMSEALHMQLINAVIEALHAKYTGGDALYKILTSEKLGTIKVCPALSFKYTCTDCKGYQLYATTYYLPDSDVTKISAQVNFKVELD